MRFWIERLAIEIIAAILLVICVTVTSAAFAVAATGRSAQGLNCASGVPSFAPSAPRCDAKAAQRRAPGE